MRRRQAETRVEPPKDAWEALARCIALPPAWVIAVAAAAVASVFRVVHRDGSTTIGFEVTGVTAAVIALVWLPTLLRVIALTGGNLKTPAGDASTTGLLRYFSALPPDQQEESLAAAAAVVDQLEVTGTPDEQSNARQVREELEEAIGEIPRPAADVARRLNEIATEYENLRAEMTSGGERTRAMTELMARARGLAASRLRRGDPSADPHRWYRTDSEGGRIVALAAVQARKDSRDLPIAVDAITNSRSAFEQFHALRAAFELLPRLDRPQLNSLRDAIQSQMAETEGQGRWITPADPDRWTLAHHSLAEIDQRTSRAS